MPIILFDNSTIVLKRVSIKEINVAASMCVCVYNLMNFKQITTKTIEQHTMLLNKSLKRIIN